MRHRAIRDKLISDARSRKSVAYSDIAPLAGLDVTNLDDRAQLGKILGEISRLEHQQGRPMLSAVVVHHYDKIPGRGFFKLDRELGLHDGEDDHTFFAKEQERLYNYWTNA